MKITRVNKFKNKTKFNKIQQKHHQCYVVYLHENIEKITRVSSGAPDIHFFPVLHSTSLVCLRRRYVPRQVPSLFTKWRYLPMELCDVILWTDRVRCALNIEILDLLNEESVSGARSCRASLLIRREVQLSTFEKVSRSLKYDSNFFSTTDIYILYIYTDTTVDHFTPLALRVRGN